MKVDEVAIREFLHTAYPASWHAHQTALVLGDDGLPHVVDTRDFTEP